MGLTITDGSDIEDVISNTEQVLAEKRKSLPDPKIVDLAQTTLSQLKKLTALFDWSDSTGIQAMQEGDFALLDEISLANDWHILQHLTETYVELGPEHSQTGPLCMNSYRWLFNSCQYPIRPSDKAKKFDLQVNTHLTVIKKGQFFEFLAVKPNGSLLSKAELKVQFNKVIQLAGPIKTPFPVEALTTEHRDTWQMREEL
ncbi:hypothetical protein Pst134EB_008594 [Puccinia striiformis f. sp. tritici]|nr:hypothetical protein Pst134EB_008594 [Puccinia striiformis f. sp. tritici]